MCTIAAADVVSKHVGGHPRVLTEAMRVKGDELAIALCQYKTRVSRADAEFTWLAPILAAPPDVAGFIALVARVTPGWAAEYGVGLAAKRFAAAFRKHMEHGPWTVHALVLQLLLPALAAMRHNKTMSFGVVYNTMKVLWRRTDWPDPDEDRSRAMSEFVAEHFFPERHRGLVAWAFAYLRLDRFFSLDRVFGLLADDLASLGLYCCGSSIDVQRAIVHRVISRAGSATERAASNAGLSMAAELIAKCRLEKREFPAVARYKCIGWLCYTIHKAPPHVSEDYAIGDPELLALCVSQLSRKEETLASAVDMHTRYEVVLKDWLSPGLRERLQHARSAMGVAPARRPDAFAPLNPEALRLPFAADDVVWVDTPELVGDLLAVIDCAAVVGIDLEWSSSGTWLDPTLALMQLSTPDCVYLVDLAALPLLEAPVDALLRRLLTSEQPLLLGFAFHHDLRELGRSPWRHACQHVNRDGICDLEAFTTTEQRGLASLARRMLGRPVCKAEQRSCWHRRPLRAAQRHYAALDAYVLLQLGSSLTSQPLTEPAALAAALHRKGAEAKAVLTA